MVVDISSSAGNIKEYYEAFLSSPDRLSQPLRTVCRVIPFLFPFYVSIGLPACMSLMSNFVVSCLPVC